MNFASASWLWALLGVPVLGLLMAWAQTRKRRALSAFADERVWARIAPELDWGAVPRKGWVFLFAISLGIVALARPQWGAHEETVQISGMDIMVLLDVSNSMDTEDVVPNRLKKARHLVRNLLDRLGGDRVGLVGFAGSAYMASPLTTDLDYIRETLDALDSRSVLNQGTDFAAALDTAYRALVRGAESGSNASQVVLFISDGEDQEKDALEFARKLGNSGVGVYAFGVGTPEGGQIPVRDEQGQLHGYKRERSGKLVVSRFNPDSLRAITEAAGGKFWIASQAETEVDELLKELGGKDRSRQNERKMVIQEDRYQWPLALAILLLLIEISLPARKLLAAVLLCCAFSGEARAGSPGSRPAGSVDVYLENRAGVKAFEAQRLQESKKHFGSAQALAPEAPELHFNQGTLLLKQDVPEEAARALDEAARAAGQSGDQALEARSLFNLGIVQAKKRELAAAVRSYARAVALAEKSGDQALEKDARKNLELLSQMRMQQGSDQNQQDPNSPSKEGSSKGSESEPKDKRMEDPSTSRQKFRSKNMSREDAELVMEELANKERQLQRRVRRQKGKSQTPEKDW